MLRKITQTLGILSMLAWAASPGLQAADAAGGDPAANAAFMVDELRGNLPDDSTVAVLSMEDEAAYQAGALFNADGNRAIFQELRIDQEETLFVSWGTTTANLYWMVDDGVWSTAVDVGVNKLLEADDRGAYGKPLREEVKRIMKRYDLKSLLFFNAIGYKIESKVLEIANGGEKSFEDKALGDFFLTLRLVLPKTRIIVKKRAHPKLDDGFLTAVGGLPGFEHFQDCVDVGGGSAKHKRRDDHGGFVDVSDLKGEDGKKINTNAILTGSRQGVVNYVQAFCQWLKPQDPVLVLFTGGVRTHLQDDPRYRFSAESRRQQLRLTQEAQD